MAIGRKQSIGKNYLFRKKHRIAGVGFTAVPWRPKAAGLAVRQTMLYSRGLIILYRTQRFLEYYS